MFYPRSLVHLSKGLELRLPRREPLASSLMLLYSLLLVFAPVGVQSDWLSISVPQHAYEGDQVVIRCTGQNNGDIKRVKYFKNSHHIATYSGSSSYTIDNAGLGDSGYYFCKADRKLFLFIDTTEETGSKWLNVQGRGRHSSSVCV